MSESRIVSEAITSRRSIRAFMPEPVAEETVRRILEIASRAPSGSNIQPWYVDVLTGEALETLKTDLTWRFDEGDYGADEVPYYPDPWREPYLARRRAVGFGLYNAVGIARGDKPGMAVQLRRNFLFFDAPVGMIFSVDRDLPVGGWLDYGMFLQNIMIAARGFGLHSCAQRAFAAYPHPIRDRLGLSADRIIVCGMALGFADPTAPANSFYAGREPVSAFARFHSRFDQDGEYCHVEP